MVQSAFLRLGVARRCKHRSMRAHLLALLHALISVRWLPALGGDPTPRPLQRSGASSASGRQSQFEQLFTRYQLPLLDYLFGMTRDREWAADLVQETFLNAYAAKANLAAIEHPQAWLYRIATNIALTALRRRRRFGWVGLSAVEPEAGASSSDSWPKPLPPDLPYQDFAATIAERDAVWSVLAELPPRWRAVLLLQTTAGFEVREIAASLHLSEANVRKLLFRAKERFRHVYSRLDARGGTQ